MYRLEGYPNNNLILAFASAVCICALHASTAASHWQSIPLSKHLDLSVGPALDRGVIAKIDSTTPINMKLSFN